VKEEEEERRVWRVKEDWRWRKGERDEVRRRRRKGGSEEGGREERRRGRDDRGKDDAPGISY
jgi:hypothetical protein